LKQHEVEKEVVILLSDMVSYASKTTDMGPAEIKDFMLEYHKNLKSIVRSVCPEEQKIESSAGDGAVAVFERKPGEGKNVVCGLALDVALEMVLAMERGLIPQTRIGLFSGHIIEAALEGRTMRFGSSFSVASRLEELCGYFGIKILMDREMAFWQTKHAPFLTSIGKVTPKNFSHPVHVFSLYKPGIHQVPENADPTMLNRFIETKNRAIEYFCGNVLQRVHPDFSLARQLLLDSQDIFEKMTGKRDRPVERVLEYISNNPQPEQDFLRVGMKIGTVTSQSTGVQLLNISSELLKAMDEELYQALVLDTEWERKFKLLWRKKDEQIIRVEDNPDGVYFIDCGSVNVLDPEGRHISTLGTGDVFGEMAYFTKKKRRIANVIANSDLVLRHISEEDLKTMPQIKKIFRSIARKRTQSSKRNIQNR
jgi:class 3 adenylate cyclase